MTREEAVAVLKAFMENPLFSDVHKAAFNIAIHDIKQRHDWDINNLILINKDNYEPLEQEPRWIPLTIRPMTDEEREYYREWSDVEGAMIFNCPLPEDGQEVLVSYGGYVCVDTFCKDDGCYFEGVDIDDVDAWMPLPEPYKAESEPQESEDKK